MTVYQLAADVDRYCSLSPSNSEEYLSLMKRFNGSPLGNTDVGMAVNLCRENEQGKRLLEGDLFGFAPGIPVLSERAVRELEDLLEDHADIISLLCGGATYYLLNVYNQDALDEERSELKRFSSSGRIMRIVRHEFLETQVEHHPIFRIPQLSSSMIYVTGEFVRRVDRLGLGGFLFTKVWTNRGERFDDSRKLPSSIQERPNYAERDIPSERPVSRDELSELRVILARGTGPQSLNEAPPKVVVEELEAYLLSHRSDPLVQSLPNEVALEFGVVYGEQFRLAFGWEWVVLTYEDGDLYAVVSPDRRYVIFPLSQVHELLANPDKSSTLALLFNMVEAGHLPTHTSREGYLPLE